MPVHSGVQKFFMDPRTWWWLLGLSAIGGLTLIAVNLWGGRPLLKRGILPGYGVRIGDIDKLSDDRLNAVERLLDNGIRQFRVTDPQRALRLQQQHKRVRELKVAREKLRVAAAEAAARAAALAEQQARAQAAANAARAQAEKEAAEAAAAKLMAEKQAAEAEAARIQQAKAAADQELAAAAVAAEREAAASASQPAAVVAQAPTPAPAQAEVAAAVVAGYRKRGSGPPNLALRRALGDVSGVRDDGPNGPRPVTRAQGQISSDVIVAQGGTSKSANRRREIHGEDFIKRLPPATEGDLARTR